MLRGGVRSLANGRRDTHLQALKVVRPTTVQEAIEQLNEGGDGARPLAGGTDVIVIARARVRDIDVLGDVKQIPELTAI